MYHKWKGRIQTRTAFFPFQGYLIAFLLCSLAGHYFLNLQFQGEPSLFNDMLAALIRLVRLVFFPLILLGLLTILIPYIWLWIVYRRRRLHIHLDAPTDVSQGFQQELRFNIYPLWQPFFGQIYYRLLYNKGTERSPKFSLVRRENLAGFAGNTQEGWYKWPVPGVREYEVNAMIIYMEDFFHFFRLGMRVKVNQSFFTSPAHLKADALAITPGKTEDEDIRIPDWRKVQGEWLQYKHFDNSDDVRRIVWKIYARNKELVVRAPEILNPYASHVSLFVSFFDGIEARFADAVRNVCLDYYKSVCYTLFQQLTAQGLKVRLYTDKANHTKHEYQVPIDPGSTFAKCSWQDSIPAEELVDEKNSPVVCISSLADVKDTKRLLDILPSDALIFFVPLSRAAPLPKGWKWIRWLWVETEKEPSYRVSLLWYLSPIRRSLVENEKKLWACLKASGKKFVSYKMKEGGNPV